jgi:hypothetical protein
MKETDSSAHQRSSLDPSINETIQIYINPFLLMHYPYSSYLLETERAKQRIARLFQPEGAPAPGANRAFARRLYWMRGDMSAASFTWTLVLLATLAASQSDQPAFWLSVGPAPLAVGFAAAALLRRRFNLCSYLRVLRPQRFLGRCQCHCQ